MRLRRALDALYAGGGALAGACLVAMLGLIVAQMVARWTGSTFRGAPDYAGYCMAGASFLAFAHALNRGAHIRVNLLLGALGPPAAPGERARGARHVAETACLAVGTLVAGYVAFYAVRAVRWSLRFGDVSQGQDATPLWIPQSVMAAGAVLLAIAFADNLVTRLLAGRDHIVVDELADGAADESANGPADAPVPRRTDPARTSGPG